MRAAADSERLREFVAMVERDDDLPPKWRAGAPSLAEDSLAFLQLERVAAAARLADIGTGAGFPGLVLAIMLPGTRISLIERRPDRHPFLSRAVRALALDNVVVVAASVEGWDAGRGACDVVTARNVAPPNSFVELAAPLLVQGGTAVTWGRRRGAMYEAEGDAAAAVVGLRREAVHEHGERGALYVYAKVGPTPPRFPRPPGQAFRDPLGLEIDPADWVPDGGTVRVTLLQRRILELLALGHRRAEVAEALDLSADAARNEVRRVKRKLAAKTEAEAVARARGCGILPAHWPEPAGRRAG